MRVLVSRFDLLKIWLRAVSLLVRAAKRGEDVLKYQLVERFTDYVAIHAADVSEVQRRGWAGDLLVTVAYEISCIQVVIIVLSSM